jgi:hypothetical protein
MIFVKHLRQQLCYAYFFFFNWWQMNGVWRCQWHRWPVEGGPNDTAHQYWHKDPTCSKLLFYFEGISIKKSYIGKLYNTISTILAKKNMGQLIYIADHKISNFKVEFLGEFESICKMTLSYISGAQMEFLILKKQWSKISWHRLNFFKEIFPPKYGLYSKRYLRTKRKLICIFSNVNVKLAWDTDTTIGTNWFRICNTVCNN